MPSENKTNEIPNERKKEEAKRKAEVVKLNMLMAIGKLSFATAMAIRRGYPNGEIEEGIDAYKKADEAFKTFERKQMAFLEQE